MDTDPGSQCTRYYVYHSEMLLQDLKTGALCVL